MAYLWTTTAEIQAYLDAESVISIGSGADDTYTEADAMRLENAIVREVVSYLTPFYEITTLSVNTLLAGIVAKMTAAQIGLAGIHKPLRLCVCQVANARLVNILEWLDLAPCGVSRDVAIGIGSIKNGL